MNSLTMPPMGAEYLAHLKSRYAFTRRDPYTPARATAQSLLEAEMSGLLLHGSPVAGLTRGIDPRPSQATRGQSVVFAGRAWVAVSSTARWTDEDFEQGARHWGLEPYMTAQRPDAYECYSKGGWVYALPPDTFEHREYLTSFEFVSPVKVRPVWGLFVEDPVTVMKELGVALT